ncbi:MAG TPA: hypothetical protein VGB42_04315, partial [Candidatus Thermoplasmatota archaeon]
MNRKIAAVAVGAAIATAGAAYAVAGDEGGHRHGRRGNKAALLERFDSNKDGQLDDQEREAAREARKAEMLQRFDTDKDGTLSDSEREAAKAERRGRREGRREEHRARLLERFDTNKNGTLDESEREAMKARFEAAAPDFAAGEYENTFTNARGEQVVIYWRNAPVVDEQGRVTSIVSGGLDVTERHRLEVEKERERAFL